MMSFLTKLIPKNIAGFLGLLEVVIPLVRELVIVVIRLLAVLMPNKVSEDLIEKVTDIADKIQYGFDKVKDFFLKVGE